MKVYGYPITAEQEKAMVAAMRTGPFTVNDVTVAAAMAGVPVALTALKGGRERCPASHAASRMIQQERKAGRIMRRPCCLVWYPDKCPNDTNGDGDCHLCVGKGRCPNVAHP